MGHPFFMPLTKKTRNWAMTEPTHNDTGRILGAILGGTLTTIIAAIVLTPLVLLVFQSFYSFNFRGSAPVSGGNWIIIGLACLVWIFMPLYAGGYVGARLVLRNEYPIAWTIAGIAFLLLLAYTGFDFGGSSVIMIMIA